MSKMNKYIEVSHEEIDSGFTRINMYGTEVSECLFNRTGRGTTWDYEEYIVHESYASALAYAESTGKILREL